MIIALSILLLVNGVFNVAVWPQFLKRVSRDDRARDAAGKATPFLIVHIVLVSIALVIGAVSVVFGALGLFGVGV
ncbi:SCO4848 family membrane protein [Plantibacter sp. YIM 135249]|uniref:SCO4848 family membrane protein n=1 Tax=Plantibacter sp. YIM 135249 TaxID=3423918 RepID=UPI003D352C36